MQLFLFTTAGFGLAMAGLSIRLLFGQEALFKGSCGRLKLPGLEEDHEKCGPCSSEEDELDEAIEV